MPGPTYKKKERGLELVVWGDADNCRVQFSKTYKDKTTGEYKQSKYLFPDELDALSRIIADVQGWITNNKTPTGGTVQHEVMGIKVNVKPSLDDDEIPW